MFKKLLILLVLLSYSITGHSVAALKKTVLDEKNLKFKEFSTQLAEFYFDGVNNLKRDELLTELAQKCEINVDQKFLAGPGDLGLKFILGFCKNTGWVAYRTIGYIDIPSPRVDLFTFNEESSTIYFYSNAFDKTLLTTMLALVEMIKDGSTIPANVTTHEINVEYTNTLLTQLITRFFGPYQIKTLINNFFGITLELPAGEKWADEQIEFTHFELKSLVKQLITLGPLINEKNKIKRIVKLPLGTIDRGGAAGMAMCYRKDRTILIGEAAYQYDDIQGEDTLIHELMHCVRHALNDFDEGYASISWKETSDYLWVTRGNSSEFISTYSTTNPDEDFGEHGTAYVRAPGKVWNTSQRKYSYLYEKVFDWTTYRFETDKNLQFSLNSSSRKDIKKPYLVGSLSENLTLKLSQPHPGTLIGRVIIRNIFDDYDQNVSVQAVFANQSRPHEVIQLTLNSYNSVNTYTWAQDNPRYSRFNKENGEYCLTAINLKDQSGKQNIITSDANKSHCFYFKSEKKGLNDLKDRPLPDLTIKPTPIDQRKDAYAQAITIIPLPEATPGNTTFEIYIPMILQKDLKEVSLFFIHEETQETLRAKFVTNCNIGLCMDYSAKRRGYIGRFNVPKMYTVGKYRLDRVNIDYEYSPIYKYFVNLPLPTSSALGIELLENNHKQFFSENESPRVDQFFIPENEEVFKLLNKIYSQQIREYFKRMNQNTPEGASIVLRSMFIEALQKNEPISLTRGMEEMVGIPIKPGPQLLHFDSMANTYLAKKLYFERLPSTDQKELIDAYIKFLNSEGQQILEDYFQALKDDNLRAFNQNNTIQRVLSMSVQLLQLSAKPQEVESLINKFAIKPGAPISGGVLQMLKIKTNSHWINQTKDDSKYYVYGALNYEDSSGTEKILTYSGTTPVCNDSGEDCHIYLYPNAPIPGNMANGSIQFKGINITVVAYNGEFKKDSLVLAEGVIEKSFIEMGERVISKKIILDLTPENFEKKKSLGISLDGK